MSLLNNLFTEINRDFNPMSSRTFSLRIKTGFRNFIVLAVISLFIFYTGLKWLVPINSVFAIVPIFLIMTVIAAYMVTQFRKIEVADTSLIIWRGNRKDAEINKTDLLGIEINFGFNFKAYGSDFGRILLSNNYNNRFRRHTFFVKIKFLLKENRVISKYKIKNTHVYDFKQKLEKHGYPIPVEYIRGKLMTDGQRRVV